MSDNEIAFEYTECDTRDYADIVGQLDSFTYDVRNPVVVTVSWARGHLVLTVDGGAFPNRSANAMQQLRGVLYTSFEGRVKSIRQSG